MKIYKYRFNKLTQVFIYLGLALAAAAIGVTVYAIISGGYTASRNITYSIIGYAAMLFAATLMIIILISLLISSYYSIDQKYVKTSFGIIKSKFEIAAIKSVILDRTTDKLAIYFDDEKFIMIVVKPEWYEDFINRLLHANPHIEYSINSKENTPDDTEKK